MSDSLIIAGHELKSRLLIGTGKFANHSFIPGVCQLSAAELITVALRRVNLEDQEDNILSYIPEQMRLLPNTTGARTAEEVVRIAQLAKATGMGNWIKIEVIKDQKYLLPDNYETIKATEMLAEEGFIVFLICLLI